MDLVAHMKAEFQRSKTRWGWVLVLEASLVGCALAAALVTVRAVSLSLAAASLVIPIIAFIVREGAAIAYGRGERLRRMLLLRDGLGRSPSAYELAQLRVELAAEVSPVSEPYFESSLPHGPQRLAMHIQESAFFTQKLARVVGNACGAVALVGLAAVVLFFWVASQVQPGTTAVTLVARSFSIFATFFAAGVFARLWRTFSSLATTAKKVGEKCDDLRRQSAVDVDDVLVTMGDYDCALAGAAPIPEFVHMSYKDRLNRAWADLTTSAQVARVAASGGQQQP
jgi:ABC-type transport system involved in cytochrome bd biosynthesis fused ATPase/permease subunit